MGRFIFVSVQHKKRKQGTEEANTQLSKKEDNISDDIHFSYAQNVIHY